MKVEIHPAFPKLLPDRDNYRNWYIDEDFSVKIEFDSGESLVIEVGKGYRFDGHSVPFLFRFLFPKASGTDLYCSMVHDLLIDLEMFIRVDRKTQDLIYKCMMNSEVYKTSDFRSKWMPRAVTLNGYIFHTFWGDNRGRMKKQTTLDVKISSTE